MIGKSENCHLKAYQWNIRKLFLITRKFKEIIVPKGFPRQLSDYCSSVITSHTGDFCRAVAQHNVIFVAPKLHLQNRARVNQMRFQCDLVEFIASVWDTIASHEIRWHWVVVKLFHFLAGTHLLFKK